MVCEQMPVNKIFAKIRWLNVGDKDIMHYPAFIQTGDLESSMCGLKNSFHN